MGTWIVSCENSPLFIALDMCLTQLIPAGTRLSPEQLTHLYPASVAMDGWIRRWLGRGGGGGGNERTY
jgi:hypothetical protein